MAEIASRASVSISDLYLCYPSKRALVVERHFFALAEQIAHQQQQWSCLPMREQIENYFRTALQEA